MADDTKVISEPKIELDEYSIHDTKSEGFDDLAKHVGGHYPAVRINGYDFSQTDIQYFELQITDFVPRLKLTIIDYQGFFTVSQYPTDGDVINVFINSRSENWKPIRLDFDIFKIRANPVNSVEQSSANRGSEKQIFSFDCRLKIPKFYATTTFAFESNTLFEHARKLAENLNLGYASNVKSTQDQMPRICAKQRRSEWLKEHIKRGWKGEKSFLTGFVDPYYFLNIIDVQSAFKYKQKVSDTLLKFTEDPSRVEEYNNVGGNVPLILSNIQQLADTTRFINKWALINNSGEIDLAKGYSQVLNWFDRDSNELEEYDLNVLNTESKPEHYLPLKGRANENRFKNEMQIYQLPQQRSRETNGNVHKNWHKAIHHNERNLAEFEKLFMRVELPQANFAITRYQMVPLAMYEIDAQRSEALKQRKKLNKEQGKPPKGDQTKYNSDNRVYGSPEFNHFLSGQFMVWRIRYKYEAGDKTIRQQLDLTRREWPTRI